MKLCPSQAIVKMTVIYKRKELIRDENFQFNNVGKKVILTHTYLCNALDQQSAVQILGFSSH